MEVFMTVDLGAAAHPHCLVRKRVRIDMRKIEGHRRREEKGVKKSGETPTTKNKKSCGSHFDVLPGKT